MSDFQEFEEALLSSRDDFVENHNRSVERAQEQFGKRSISSKKIDLPREAPKTPAKRKNESYPGVAYKTGYIVKLAVRKKRISFLDDIFEHRSSKLSKLEAKIDAERAAKDAGYPIIGHVHSIEKL